MKAFVILWALGLAACDKLDRTYLPPPGAVKAGGHHEDLDLPLEFPKENYPSTLALGSAIYDPQRPNYPNVAIGIDRQGPVTSSDFTFGTRAPSAKNIYNVPTTGAPFTKNIFNSPTTAFNRFSTTTLSPTESYETTVGSTRTTQYPSTISTFEPSNFDSSQQFGSDLTNSSLERQNENIGQTYTSYPNGSVNFQPAKIHHTQQNVPNRPISGVGLPGRQSSNIGPLDSTNLSPQNYVKPNQPNNQYRSKIGNIPGAQDSGVTNPDNYDEQTVTYKPYNQQSREDVQYSTPQTSDFHDENVRTRDFTRIPSTIAPSQYPEGVLPSSYRKIVDRLDSRYNARPERIQADADRNAVILDYRNLLTSDGFAYSYDTSNGIHADESGTAVDGVRAQGSYSYIGDDGQVYRITYTADENGFLPRGDHLPTAPPIPSAILKVIEEAEMNRRLGVSDDGSYDDSKYGHDRYQGLVGRIPQDKYKYMIRKQQSNQNGVPKSEMISYEEGKGPNESRRLQDTYTGDVSTSTGRPSLSHADVINQNNAYGPQKNNQFVPSNANNPNFNTFSSSDEEKVNPDYTVYGPQGKLSGNANVRPSETHSQNFIAQNPNMNTNLGSGNRKYGENPIQTSDEGYEYVRPQNVFNQDRTNSYRPSLTNNNDQNDRDRAENVNEGTVSIPRRLFNNDVQPSKQDINGPVTTAEPYNVFDQTDSNIYQTQSPIFDNRELDTGIDTAEKDSQRIINKGKPYRPSTSGPYNYGSPVTSNFPSTLRGQYAVSTTPLPSIYSPQSTLITNGADYQTTPFGTFVTSTSRPLITSKTPGSFSRRPNYATVSEKRPFSDVRTSTTRPSIINRVTGKPEFRDRPGSISNNEFVQHTPQRETQEVGLNFEPSGPAERPTEKVVAEDFTGPKQRQRFDPERGYYY